MNLFRFAPLALLAGLLAPAANASSRLVGTIPFSFSGGTGTALSAAQVTVIFGHDFYSSDHVEFSFQVPDGAANTDEVIDGSTPGFTDAEALLTNGVDDTIWPKVVGASVGHRESTVFSTTDLAGATLQRIVVHIDQSSVASPGSNPNGDGNWTDFSVSGEVEFYAQYPQLTVITPLPAGDICPNGGRRVDSGGDLNLDGTLSSDEVENTSYACDGPTGADGQPVVLTSSDIEPGPTCAAGGVLVTVGYDTDGDGQVDEVTDTLAICNGQEGQQGETGQPGADGKSCTVTKSGEGLTITCPDGSSESLSAAQGCSSTGGSPSGLLPLLALGLLGLGRRRTAL
jgi:MYXO-CTERM domain-containing protein